MLPARTISSIKHLSSVQSRPSGSDHFLSLSLSLSLSMCVCVCMSFCYRLSPAIKSCWFTSTLISWAKFSSFLRYSRVLSSPPPLPSFHWIDSDWGRAAIRRMDVTGVIALSLVSTNKKALIFDSGLTSKLFSGKFEGGKGRKSSGRRSFEIWSTTTTANKFDNEFIVRWRRKWDASI